MGDSAGASARQPLAAATGASLPPLWKESLWPVDWVTLRVSPVYYGFGVPRGDGSPVVLVPGLLGTDAYLYELYLWLGRIGYRPYMSGIGINAECLDHLTSRLLGTMRSARKETGKPVRIIGHSLGGLIGRRACLQQPALASQLVYLGSPVQAVHTHPAITATIALLRATLALLSADREDCLTEHCRCGFFQTIVQPLPDSIHHAAIYTRADGIVDWHDAQDTDPHLNYEVGGTHVGLVFNPRAYRVLGGLLAYPSRNDIAP